MKFVVSTLLCTAGFISAIGWGMEPVFAFLGNSTVQEPLTSVSFSRGGDMLGSHHAMSVKAKGDKAWVCYENAAWHNQVPEIEEYLVPVALLGDIKTIFNEQKLAKCEKAPKSKIFVCDGATSSYRFCFSKRCIHFSTTQELPDGAYAALQNISTCVADACQKGERLPGLALEKDAQGELPTKNVLEKGKVTVKVTGYKGQQLYFAVGNDTEQEQTIPREAKITELSNPTAVVAERSEKESIKLDRHTTHHDTWKLEKRLEAGTYRLDLGSYTTCFVIR